MPKIYVAEAYGWCGTGNLTSTSGLQVLLTRYGQPPASGGMNIVGGGGPFGGTNAMELGGGGFAQPLNIPTTQYTPPFNPPIRMGSFVRSAQWAAPGFLMGFSDSGSGIPGGHQNVYAGMGTNLAGQLCIVLGPFNSFNQGTIVANGTHILTNNAYYFIEFELLSINAVTGQCNVYLNGVLECSYTGNTAGTGALSNQVYQFYLGSPQTPGPWSFQSTYLSDTLLGPCKMADFTPIADGALTQWTPLVGPPSYPEVNSIPPGFDTAYIADSTPGDISVFAFTPLAAAGQVVLGVQVSVFARKDDLAAHTIAAVARSGGTNFAGATLPALTSNYLGLYLQNFETDPNTGLSWTPTGLNAAQFGVKLVS